MLATRQFHFRDARAVGPGLGELRLQGLTPRGLLFLAVDPSGLIRVSIPDDPMEVTRVRIGDKLSLAPPAWPGARHFDAIHRLPSGGVLFNGDAVLDRDPMATEVALGVAGWVKGSGAHNVFFGCTPHEPGSWWVRDDGGAPLALHAQGVCDVVTTPLGLLARRTGEADLVYLPFSRIGARGPGQGWQTVFTSSLGRILMLERRPRTERVVASCERGLVEVDVGSLPAASEALRVELSGGFGVVGRVEGGFCVTVGEPRPWGLADVAPALLIGAHGDTLRELARSLRGRTP